MARQTWNRRVQFCCFDPIDHPS